MTDWQRTAITILCSKTAEEVTVIIDSDWSVMCNGYEKYGSSRDARIKLLKKGLFKIKLMEMVINPSKFFRYFKKRLTKKIYGAAVAKN